MDSHHLLFAGLPAHPIPVVRMPPGLMSEFDPEPTLIASRVNDRAGKEADIRTGVLYQIEPASNIRSIQGSKYFCRKSPGG